MDGRKLPRLGPEQECDLIKDRTTGWSGLQTNRNRASWPHSNFPAQNQEWAHPYSPPTPLPQLPKNTQRRGFHILSHCQGSPRGLIDYIGTSKMITI